MRYLIAMMVCAFPSLAQDVCGDRSEILSQLEQRYHERPVAVGLSNGGTLLEITASPDGSTWTLIVSQPNGFACLKAAGEGWRQAPPNKDGST